MLICDEDGDLLLIPSDGMSTSNADTISNPATDYNTNQTDRCGDCMAVLVASSSHNCKYHEAHSTGKGITTAIPDNLTPQFIIMIICN